MKKFLDCFMWLVFLTTFLVAIVNMLVVFGVVWSVYLKFFTSYFLIEICLSACFYLWGINNLYNNYTKNSKCTFYVSMIFASILLVFTLAGVY